MSKYSIAPSLRFTLFSSLLGAVPKPSGAMLVTGVSLLARIHAALRQLLHPRKTIMNIKKLVFQCWIGFLLGVVFLSHSPANAFAEFQLSLDGELVIEPFNVPPTPALEEVFGLQNGDPFNFSFNFDPTALVGVQDSDFFSGFNVNSFEVELGSLRFVDEPSRDFFLLATPVGDSGFNLSFDGAFLQESESDNIQLGLYSALNTFFSFQTGDIGADLSQLPSDLSIADITSFSSGTFGLFGQNGDFSNVLLLNPTGISVTAVPEPSSGVVLAIATLVLIRRRRGY